ncbi:MAG: hypothetical protein Q4D04_14540 [Clostridia bacterium]|nr:hypothetical protein [Clostridia bacterium]
MPENYIRVPNWQIRMVYADPKKTERESNNSIRKSGKDTFAVSIKQVIFNPPATIVLWDDGTKTVVKTNDEPFDKEKGLAMAISKRMAGNKGRYFNEFKKWCHEDSSCKIEDINNTFIKYIVDFEKAVNPSFHSFPEHHKECREGLINHV